MAAIMQARIENDCVLLQTDITFNLAIEILNSLQRDNRLQVCTYQVVTIDNIESDDRQDHHRFRFGGSLAANPRKSLQCFARTASSVLRMCMGRSVNANFSPKLGAQADRRNRSKMVYVSHGIPFVLAYDRMTMMEYYSSYDHLHPHFKIEHQFESAQPTDWWYMPLTMMLIFRQNFTEVIEISTSLQAGNRPQYGHGTFQSYVNVRCIVRRISDPEHGSLKILKALKNDPSKILLQYQQALNLPNFHQIGDPWAAAETDDDDDDDDSEESDSEPEYVQTKVDPNIPTQAITPKSAPPNLFASAAIRAPGTATPVIQRLGERFSTLVIAGQP